MSRTITIPTPPPRSEVSQYTPGPDHIRGTHGDNFLHPPLLPREQAILESAVAVGLARPEVLDAIFLGELRRPLSAVEGEALVELLAQPRPGPLGTTVSMSLIEALPILEAAGAPSFDDGPEPPLGRFAGGDSFFGQGGNNYIADLRGNNLVMTGEGDDHILLGRGNDRVFDKGGDNGITVLGGNNSITTGDGDDFITTGNGNDIINAFGGRNVINAGNGDNMVRGGNGFDFVTVGTGDDFVEVRRGAPDDFEVVDLPFIGVFGYEAHDIVLDFGGSDMIRATSSITNTLVLSDVGGEIFGDDLIEVGGGNNIVVDFGGNSTVRTGGGDDIIFTSFVSPGDNTIDAASGNNFINPGAGSDVVRGGPGGDTIDLENDGYVDTLLYLDGDQSFHPHDTDIVLGFEGERDLIDVSALGMRLPNLMIFNAAVFGIMIGDETLPDLLIAWDADLNGVLGAGDFFTTILADFDPSTLTPDNFVFASDALV